MAIVSLGTPCTLGASVRFLLVLATLLLAACTDSRLRNAPSPTARSVQTASVYDDRPIHMLWSTHTGHARSATEDPNPQYLRLQGGQGEIDPTRATEVRLIDPSEQEVARGKAAVRKDGAAWVCGWDYGTIYASIPVSGGITSTFAQSRDLGDYRVEVWSGDSWRRTQLAFGGCASIE